MLRILVVEMLVMPADLDLVRERTQALNLAVITFNDVPALNPTYKYEFLGRIAIENRRQYCSRHGYNFISDIAINRDRPPCWAKIPAILDALRSHNWVLWADSDTLVFNQFAQLDELCDSRFDLIVQSHEDFFRFVGIPLEGGMERMPINTGVFLIKASPWSHEFLERAYERTEYVSHAPVWDGIGEQEAMIALLRENPRDRQHIKYVNRLQNHPKFHSPGDRFVHFYGNHAKHLVPPGECAEVLRRWELAVKSAGALPRDVMRFHWCCIQNKSDNSTPVRGDLAHYLYCPEDIAA